MGSCPAASDPVPVVKRPAVAMVSAGLTTGQSPSRDEKPWHSASVSRVRLALGRERQPKLDSGTGALGVDYGGSAVVGASDVVDN